MKAEIENIKLSDYLDIDGVDGEFRGDFNIEDAPSESDDRDGAFFSDGHIDQDNYNMAGDFSYEDSKIHLRTTGDIDTGYLNSVIDYNR